MKTAHYEWRVLEIDENGDVEDFNAFDTVAECVKVVSEHNATKGLGIREVELHRYTIDEFGGRDDYEYAVFDSDDTPTHFDGGTKIPAKYLNQWNNTKEIA